MATAWCYDWADVGYGISMKYYKNTSMLFELALESACRRLTRVCPYDNCPIMITDCMSTVPTMRDCAMRLKKYLVRRARQ